MSYNGSGTFVINSAGTPYVSGTVISSTAANSLNSDLATGLSTAICKDGQSTPTANIGLGGFKITNLGAGTVASDAARLSQVQNSGTTTLISITGTDTITGTVTPTLTAYTAGQVFSFVVAATNTGAVTLNINSLGATAVTRTGAVALVAGDMVTGQVAIVEYDGTRFQLINGNSFTNLKASGTLGVTGITTVAAGSAAAPTIVSTTGTADTGQFFPAADTIAWSTAGTERVRISSSGAVLAQATSESASTGAGIKLLTNRGGTANRTQLALVGVESTSATTGFSLYSTGAAAYRFYIDDDGKPYSTLPLGTISDARLKTNIKNISYGLEDLLKIRPVNFDWKDGSDTNRVGFIAQELKPIISQAVTDTKNIAEDKTAYMAVTESNLIPVMVKAIQEQQAIIETLTARIAALETA